MGWEFDIVVCCLFGVGGVEVVLMMGEFDLL